ncbi:Acg family FMN-binding oxidoreductase [Nocardia sp. NPDC020380]|uniref:Acg family FMN-binding oxidoreductase n=1 Tax=Nocardia sp. NPDC020380 TaxID=3364309 RepID=UPI0037BBE41B
MVEDLVRKRRFAAAIAMAVRAPSVHNTQPWRWRLTGDAIELHADRDRHLQATDPTSRALLMSCGATLHHLRVALSVHGLAAAVAYLPDDSDPDHLATVTVTPADPTQDDIELAAAITHRESDRRRYDSRPVPSAILRAVASSAPHFGVVARLIPPPLRTPLADITHDAAARHAVDPEYQRELATWSGRHGTPDGVPAANTPPQRLGDAITVRAFASPELTDIPETSDGSEWLVLGTPADDPRARLRAGEAASALLLTATRYGLASCLQTEPLGIPDLAATIGADVMFDCAFPQALVRFGWVSSHAAPLPRTPRRPLADIIDTALPVS